MFGVHNVPRFLPYQLKIWPQVYNQIFWMAKHYLSSMILCEQNTWLHEFVQYCVIIATQSMGKKTFEYDYRVVTICCVLAAQSIGVLSCPIVLLSMQSLGKGGRVWVILKCLGTREGGQTLVKNSPTPPLLLSLKGCRRDIKVLNTFTWNEWNFSRTIIRRFFNSTHILVGASVRGCRGLLALNKTERMKLTSLEEHTSNIK